MASIFGGSFSQLRQALGLADSPRYSLPVDTGNLGFGTDYLRSNNGAGALYELYAGSLDPQLSGVVRRNKGRIEDAYQAAAAVDSGLQRDQFLNAYDPEKLYKSLTPYDRGENPRAFGRQYRLLQA
jgi:hypothetical protein